jgi:uncharacterized cupredoxin-like copper-binding protein
MTIARRHLLALACAVLVALSAQPAGAATSVVRVSLWDNGAMSMRMLGHGPMMGMGMGMGTGRQGGGPHGGPMGITTSVQTVPAGTVTFAVTNVSTVMVHEMVLSPVKDVHVPLPYDRAANKVDEDAAGHLGEVADLEPGKNGALTLDLKPGQYILYCNIAGHYALGMWTLLTVT